jgi:3-isopropylmalate/(R)-2-methylmalate dehydratase small subunit
MQKFTQLTAIACPLPLSGIDTDQLIPARFINRQRSEGFAAYLLHDLRKEPGFPLNDPLRAGARIIVARRNFGGGSSREAAVYALQDYGIACVIAPSFGDIFASNAVGNGLLPAVATENDVETMLDTLSAGTTHLTVDLTDCRISTSERAWSFSIDPVWREKLLNGWDDLDFTRSLQPAIDAFLVNDRTQRPWAYPM